MVFSVAKSKENAILKKIDRAIIMSGLAKTESTGNPSYIAVHGYKTKDEVRKKIRDEVTKFQENHRMRMKKNVPK